jgi:hypothetical protein
MGPDRSASFWASPSPGLQAFEYWELIAHKHWTFGEDKFFSTFFMATGFHGLHVIIGTIFLFICFLRVRRAISRPRSISGSRRRPGTGTSSTWSGCSSSRRSTSGVRRW